MSNVMWRLVIISTVHAKKMLLRRLLGFFVMLIIRFLLFILVFVLRFFGHDDIFLGRRIRSCRFFNTFLWL